MPLFQQQQCQEPEVLQEVKNKELKMENLINKYRVILIIAFIICDFIAMHFLNAISTREVMGGLPLFLIAIFALFRIHQITKSGQNKPYIKYATILLDYLVVFFALFHSHSIICNATGITVNQLALIGTILLILINSTSALRIQYNIIKFSIAVGLITNILMHFMLGSGWGIMLYTSMFIILSGFFNLYVAGFIFQSFIANHRLKDINNSLGDANNEITTQNEEIKTQNDELETQNDYLAQQRDQITHQKQQITSSIEYAKHIQDAMLPTVDEVNRVTPNNFIYYKPKDIVSGDFYWFKKITVATNQYSIYATVDCTGHGVPGGFLSMMGFSFLNEIAINLPEGFSAATILNQMRDLVKHHLHQSNKNLLVRDGMDMTICVIDYKTNQLQYAGANNPLYIIRSENIGEDNCIEEVVADKMPVGVHIKEKNSFKNNTVAIKHGDILYTFTDGFIDQFGGSTIEKFKKKRFRSMLERISSQPMEKQKALLSQQYNDWAGKNEQLDDICIIGVMI